jgi:hypothetical protein
MMPQDKIIIILQYIGLGLSELVFYLIVFFNSLYYQRNPIMQAVPADISITMNADVQRLRTSNGIVDALIINSPDLSLFIRLQNLTSFFIDNLNSVASDSELRNKSSLHMRTCLNHIQQIVSEKEYSFNTDILKVVDELLEEGNSFLNLLQVFPPESEVYNHPSEALIAAKASQLQWLAVCLSEELKKPFSFLKK